MSATGNGTVLEVNREATGCPVLQAFTGRDGEGLPPPVGLVLGREGMLDGKTRARENHSVPAVFRLSPQPFPSRSP